MEGYYLEDWSSELPNSELNQPSDWDWEHHYPVSELDYDFDLEEAWGHMTRIYCEETEMHNDWFLFGVPHMDMSGHRIGHGQRTKGGVRRGYKRNKRITSEEFEF